MKRTLLSLAALCVSAILLAGVGRLMQWHILVLREVRESSLPLAAELPPLERRLALLTEQVELSELQSTLRSGSAEEKLKAFVLPENSDLPRILSFFDIVRASLEKQKVLTSMSPITVGDPHVLSVPEGYVRAESDVQLPELQAQTLTFSVTVTPEGREQLFDLLDLSGLVTVGDALGEGDMKKLFKLTEGGNTSGIVPVEQFLSTDLLAYIRDPKLTDVRLTQAFPSEQFIDQFHALLNESRLATAKRLLEGPLGQDLLAEKLWPTQFVLTRSMASAEQPGGTVLVTLELDVLSRK